MSRAVGNLTHTALRLFIEKTQHDLNEGRSWIRQPNNLISLVAIVLSLLSIGYQLIKDYYDGVDKNLASLSQIVSDLTKMDGDAATVNNAQLSQNLAIALTNRRMALLTEADRLIKNLGSRAPADQLAILGPEYVSINDYQTALTYFRKLLEPPSTPTERLSAWRSIALVYADEGPPEWAMARAAFARAAAILPDPHDVGSINLELTVHENWAQFESSADNYQSAFLQFLDARLLANRFPCIPEREPALRRLDQEASTAIVVLRASAPDVASIDDEKMKQAVASDSCPETPASAPTAQAVPSEQQPATTTVCRFTSGPRSGSKFDFAPYGVRAVQVGSPCTDGQGSYGVAVR